MIHKIDKVRSSEIAGLSTCRNPADWTLARNDHGSNMKRKVQDLPTQGNLFFGDIPDSPFILLRLDAVSRISGILLEMLYESCTPRRELPSVCGRISKKWNSIASP